MADGAGEAGRPAAGASGDAGRAAPDASPDAERDAERAAYEGRPRSYWGLRPRRGIRRMLLVVFAAALACVLAWELVVLWRRTT